MTDHDWGIDMTDEEGDAFCAALADMRPRHVEPLGWVLRDLRTTNPNMVRIDSRDEAHADVQRWDLMHPEQAGRFVVCALVPDGRSYSCGVPSCCPDCA